MFLWLTDTDVIYVVREGQILLSTGNYLGQLTDELNEDFITDYVAAGPKSYAYLTRFE